MDLTYDIFKRLPDSTPLWVEAVVGLEEAAKRVESLSDAAGGAYLMYDPRIASFVDRPADDSLVLNPIL
ncbi:MAG: hypothetical protein ACRD5R_05605 [Candidatus Acidiferrales bacterium]